MRPSVFPDWRSGIGSRYASRPVVRGRVWLVVLPLLAIGGEGAHSLLGIFAPAGYQGAELFGGSFGDRTLLPLLLALAAVMLLGGLFAASAEGRSLRVSRTMVAVLPLVAFAIQEHVEYAIGHGGMSWTVAAHPTFALGLALQLPFAVVACFAARCLLVLADAVVTRRAAPRGKRLDFRPLSAPTSGTTRPRGGRPSGDARFNRGPPPPISV